MLIWAESESVAQLGLGSLNVLFQLPVSLNYRPIQMLYLSLTSSLWLLFQFPESWDYRPM